MSNNEPPQAGHNEAPDWGKMQTDELTLNYAGMVRECNKLLEQAREIPLEITTEAEAEQAAAIIVKLRAQAKVIDGSHGKEKAPHKAKGEATDSFFFGWWEKLARRNKSQVKPGAADIVLARLDDYNQRKLAAEQRRLRQEALDARKEADQLQAEAEVAQQERLAAEAAAARAKKPETQVAKTAVADMKTEAARVAQVDAMLANDKAAQAQVAAAAKPADIVRTRNTATGTTTTMQTENYANVTDRNLLDKELLWPHLSDDAIAKALAQWARGSGHKVQMAGAVIGSRPKTRVLG